MNTEGKGGINEDSQIFGLGNCVDAVYGQNKHNFQHVESEDVKHSSGNVKEAPLPNLCQRKYFHFFILNLNSKS